MKNKKLFGRILAFIMTLLILMVSLPIYAFASAIDSGTDSTEGATEAEAIDATPNNELYVLEEDVSLREENVKHFKLSDGTMKAVSYATAVHYQDADGNWIDIDNSLTLSGSEYTAKNKTEIKFANKSGSNGLISIKDGEYKIDFTPLNTNKVSVEIENPERNNSRKFDDVKKLNKLVSKATYKDVYSGIDLEYILVGNNVKENIIVNEKQNSYTYSFEIKLNKLNAVLVDNAIILNDSETGEKVYEIPAPYMLDANGKYSDSVEYTLTKDSKWKYTLTVTADPSWINAEEREFPVKIDPTLTSGTVTKELFVMEDGVYDDLSYFIVGNFMGVYYDVPSFIKFDALTKIPENVLFLDARLLLHVPYVENTTGKEFNVGIYGAESNWYSKNIAGTYDINYNNASTYYYPTLTDSVEIKEAGVYSWNITGLYIDWLADSNSNHGVCIKGIDLPTADDTTASSKIVNLRISNSKSIDYMIPTIELSYRHLVGVENYYGYLENTLGDVGKSYVNLYNGSLTYINHLTSIEVGENLTYDINMVYNSIDKAWAPSFAENIEPYNALGVEQYIWTDEDGTKHLFTPILKRNSWGGYIYYEEFPKGNEWLVNDPSTFYPEDDIDYVLIQTENDEFILRDYDGNQKLFDSNGRLLRICDAQGNLIYINHLGENNIASIYFENSTDGEVLLAEMSYDSNGKLCYIYDMQHQKEINIFWNRSYINSISYHNYDETTSYKQILFGYNENNTNLEYVFDNSINQKISYYIDAKEDEDASNDEIIIEIININGSQEKTTKKYIVGKGFYKDLGHDLAENTNDDFLKSITFDEKGRENKESHTYNDELTPESIYFSIKYNQNIYNEGFNLVKYNVETGEKEFVRVDEENVTFDLTNISTIESSSTKVVSKTSEAPYQMVCEIIPHYSNSTVSPLSTGFLVGSNILIMSGHGLLEDVTDDGEFQQVFPTSVDVVTGYYSNEDEQYINCEVVTCYVHREYYYLRNADSPDRFQYDWAVCILDENVGAELGWFELIVPNEIINNENIQMIGHISSDYMFHSKGEIISFQETIKHNMNTWSGMSGGPVMLNNEDYLVVGIEVAGYDKSEGGVAKNIDLLIYTLVNNLNSTE